jgi:hypothetical protein
MRVVTNENLVKRNKNMATRLFFFSLLILIGGFILANGPILGVDALEQLYTNEAAYVLLMPLVLMIGFATTLISVRQTNLWVRVPRPEDALPDGLKGLSNKSSLYNYYHLPARHILLAPQGVYAIVTRYQEGQHVVEDDRWRTKRGCLANFVTFFRMDGIGNPTRDAQMVAAYVQEMIKPFAPDVEVQPLIVFTDPRAEVEIIGETSVPVLYADTKRKPNLKDYMREQSREGNQLGPAELDELIDEFEETTLPDEAFEWVEE